MQSNLLVLTFGTLALVNAAPTADYGSWDVTYSDNSFNTGYHSKQIITAYNNAALENPIPAACDWVKSPSKGEPEEGCSPDSFSYELKNGTDGKQVVSLQQTVTLDGEQVTVYGEGEVSVPCTSDEEKTICEGKTTIPVSKAVA